MASTTQKWLMGCGIGCGVLILICAVVFAVGYFFVRGTVEEFKDLEAASEEIEERFGEAVDYVPELDGAIAPERMDAFLAVRESTHVVREELVGSFDSIADRARQLEQEGASFWKVIGIIRSGVGVIPQFAEYYKARNMALIDEGMGLGEYDYIYILAYYSWLGRPPEDGPKFRMMGGEESGAWMTWDEDEEGTRGYGDEVYEERRYRIVKKARRLIMAMIRNQLDRMDDLSPGEFDADWRRLLEDEIEALREDRDRIPWEDGLPEVLEASFKPYQSRLEAAYDKMINPLELAPFDE